MRRAGLVAALLAPAILAGCDSRHERYGFASGAEMAGAHAAGFQTKERVKLSMTPLQVPTFDLPREAFALEARGKTSSREILGTCESVYACALAVMAAAKEADTGSIQAGVSRIKAMPQYARGGGSTSAMADWAIAKRISHLSRSRKAQAREELNEGLNINPRGSGVWLGMAVYQGLHGTMDDAVAAAWLSWYFATDRGQAVARIRSLFFVEPQPTMKAVYGRAIVWIERGIRS